MSHKQEIERKLQRALSVGELIEQLKDYPNEALVVFTCDYGDHCHTDQALPVISDDDAYEGSEDDDEDDLD